MPITISEYDHLADEMRKTYEEAERVMLGRVSKRLAKGVNTPGWTERKYSETRAARQEIQSALATIKQGRGATLAALISAGYTAGTDAFVTDAEKFSDILGVKSLSPNAQKVANILFELSASMDAADRRILRQANDAYTDIVGRTTALMATGTITTREAVQRELNEFADRGIASFVDKAGRRWDMSTYAEMATITAIENATLSGYIDTMQAYGFDLAVISSHIGACPLCVAWEGVIVSVSGNDKKYPSLDEAKAAGAFHPRCLHYISTYYGEDFHSNTRSAPRPVQQPTANYATRQRQRYCERQIRKWKRRMAVALSPEEERKAYAHVKAWQSEVKDLVDNAESNIGEWLPRKYDREGGRIVLSPAAKKLNPKLFGPVNIQHKTIVAPPTPPPPKRYTTIASLTKDIQLAQSKLDAAKANIESLTGQSYDSLIAQHGSIANYIKTLSQAQLSSQPYQQFLQSYSIITSKQKEIASLEDALDKKQVKKKLNALQKASTKLQGQLSGFNTKKAYSGIWKSDVTLDDYTSKAASITAKKQYFADKLAVAVDQNDIQKWKKLLQELNEFETQGKAYSGIKQQYDQAVADYNALKKAGTLKASPTQDAYTKARKDAALWAKSPKEYDTVMRKRTGELWQKATQAEKDAIYDYTKGSGKFNRPLSGFDRTWDWANNLGVGKVPLDNEGAKQEIIDLTNLLSKCTYDKDVWLQHGCTAPKMDSFLGLPAGKFASMSNADLQKFVGQSRVNYAFMSCGSAKGKGFDTSPVILNIYAPKGTNMLYSEPFSFYGGSHVGKNWNGVTGQSYFGLEDETLIQRGATYQITKIEKTLNKVYIDVEIALDKGYDLRGQP